MYIPITNTYALEYHYESGNSENDFYNSTSTDTEHTANSDTIVVSSDGTISTDNLINSSSSPLSSFQLPVGEYPDSWGIETDISISQNTVFPNVLAPTVQMSGVQNYPQYDNPSISSSSLPTHHTQISNIYNHTPISYNSFVPTSQSNMPSISNNGAIGHLLIPSIGLNKYVYEGISNSNMSKGIAHFECTAGWNGNIAFAAHNRGSSAYFSKLKNLKYGDTIIYTTAYGTRTYQVINNGVCNTTDTTGLQQDGMNKLTLYTCMEDQPNIKQYVTAVQLS